MLVLCDSQAAGHGVFALPLPWGEGPDLEVHLQARRIRSDHPDGVESARVDGLGLQRQNRLRVGEQQRHPSRTVVGPLRAHDLIMIDAEIGHDLCQVLGLDISASDQWRCSEGEPRSVAANAYQSCSAPAGPALRNS
jgi:hypothetical protein